MDGDPFYFVPEGGRESKGVGLIFFLNLSPKTVNALIDVTDVEFAVLSGQSDSEGGGPL